MFAGTFGKQVFLIPKIVSGTRTEKIQMGPYGITATKRHRARHMEAKIADNDTMIRGVGQYCASKRYMNSTKMNMNSTSRRDLSITYWEFATMSRPNPIPYT